MKHASGFFYLSEKGGEDKGENVFRKRILYEGKFVHPHRKGDWLNISKEHITDAVKNFKNGAMDRVQMYFTHNEDPRNLAGSVIGLIEGVDPIDNKYSLYADVRTEDPAAVTLIKNNAVGISAGIDHWYKEHASGKDLGMVVKHVALVGEGYIKQLGEFLPIPGSKQLATNMSEMSEHSGAFMFLEEPNEEDADEKKKKELADEEKRKKELDDADKKKKESKVPATKDELIAQAKELGFVVLTEPDHKEIMKAVGFLTTLREGLKDRVKFGEGDDIATAIIKDYTSRDETEKTRQATDAVVKLVEKKLLLPAQKDIFIGLFKSDKKMFDSLVTTLQPVKVQLGEKGKDDGTEPNEGDDDPKKIAQHISDALVLADQMNIPINADGKAIAGIGKKS